MNGGRFANVRLMYTTVAQLASFCLLSLRSDVLRGLLLETASQATYAALQKWSKRWSTGKRVS